MSDNWYNMGACRSRLKVTQISGGADKIKFIQMIPRKKKKLIISKTLTENLPSVEKPAHEARVGEEELKHLVGADVEDLVQIESTLNLRQAHALFHCWNKKWRQEAASIGEIIKK